MEPSYTQLCPEGLHFLMHKNLVPFLKMGKTGSSSEHDTTKFCMYKYIIPSCLVSAKYWSAQIIKANIHQINYLIGKRFSIYGSGTNSSDYHRHLQSCVGTWARLGYAAFDVQLWKAYFVTTLYAIHISVCAQARVCYISVFMSGPRDMSMHDSK